MSSIDSDIAATAARVHFKSDESKLLTEKLKDLHALIDLVDDKFSGVQDAIGTAWGCPSASPHEVKMVVQALHQQAPPSKMVLAGSSWDTQHAKIEGTYCVNFLKAALECCQPVISGRLGHFLLSVLVEIMGLAGYEGADPVPISVVSLGVEIVRKWLSAMDESALAKLTPAWALAPKTPCAFLTMFGPQPGLGTLPSKLTASAASFVVTAPPVAKAAAGAAEKALEGPATVKTPKVKSTFCSSASCSASAGAGLSMDALSVSDVSSDDDLPIAVAGARGPPGAAGAAATG